MSHEFESGFTVREPAWHGLGNVLDEPPTDWDDARRAAGLMWEPELVPVFAQVPGSTEPGAYPEPTYVEVPDHRIIRRDDTHAPLGVAKSSWEPITHATMGEVIEAILNEPNVEYVTGGSLVGGAKVYALARLDEPVAVAGDDTATYPYIVALNGHDGQTAFRIMPTSIRVVCWNTYRAAELEGEKSGRSYTFRHTASVAERIAEAKAAVTGTREAQGDWIKLAAELAALPAREAEWDRFVADFIPDPAEHAGHVVSDRVRENVAKNRSTLRRLIAENPTTDGHRGTALGLVDAGVEYLDHLRGYRSKDTLLGRQLLRPEPLKANAVRIAREVCMAG